MKRFALVSLLIALLLCLAPACGTSEEDVTLSPTPFGQLSAEEAELILYEHLASQIKTVTDSLRRYALSEYLFRTKSRWEVHGREVGQSYWEITGMGFDGLQANDSGLWRVYDATKTVEPQNNYSQELVTFIQSQ